MSDNGEKKKLLDYDHATLPEEKLMTYGAEALSDSELLALFLRTGTTGRTAIEVAQDIIDSLERAELSFHRYLRRFSLHKRRRQEQGRPPRGYGGNGAQDASAHGPFRAA